MNWPRAGSSNLQEPSDFCESSESFIFDTLLTGRISTRISRFQGKTANGVVYNYMEHAWRIPPQLRGRTYHHLGDGSLLVVDCSWVKPERAFSILSPRGRKVDVKVVVAKLMDVSSTTPEGEKVLKSLKTQAGEDAGDCQCLDMHGFATGYYPCLLTKTFWLAPCEQLEIFQGDTSWLAWVRHCNGGTLR